MLLVLEYRTGLFCWKIISYSTLCLVLHSLFLCLSTSLPFSIPHCCCSLRGLNVDDSQDSGKRPRAGTNEEMEERRKRLGDGPWVARGRDLQTNLITSLQNGITASFRIAHFPEREEEGLR